MENRKTRDIYNELLRLTDMTEGRFITLYNMTISELCTEYGERFVLTDVNKTSVKTVNEDALNLREYDGAIINNIIFLDDNTKTIHKEMSISQSGVAYRRVWRDMKDRKTALPRVYL